MQAIHRLIELRPQKFSDVVVVRANLQNVAERLESYGDDQHARMLFGRWLA